MTHPAFDGTVPIPLGMEPDDIRGIAFHDVTCPAGIHCANRLVHARSHDLVRTGVLARYDEAALETAVSLYRHNAGLGPRKRSVTVDPEQLSGD